MTWMTFKNENTYDNRYVIREKIFKYMYNLYEHDPDGTVKQERGGRVHIHYFHLVAFIGMMPIKIYHIGLIGN